MSNIEAAEFVDMILGDTYCDVKNLGGSSSQRCPAPETWADEIDQLRDKCKEIYASKGDPEFVCIWNDTVIFRVTQMLDINQQDVFFIRRTSPIIRKAQSLGLPKPVLDTWRTPDLRGLVLITGEMGHGKTSTAASLIVDRLEHLGGLAIAVEDPLETILEGRHGELSGRCIQVQASRQTGGFKEHLLRTMRTGADIILIGEIRDGATAEQAALAALNGHLIIATLHANTPTLAIERFITLVKSGNGIENAEDIVASGLSMVITQTLTRIVPRETEGKTITRLSVKHLLLCGQDGLGIREKIRTGRVQSLNQDVDIQARSSTFS